MLIIISRVLLQNAGTAMTETLHREPGISHTNQFTVNIFHRVWPHTKSFKEHVTDHMPMRTHCIYISDFLKEYQRKRTAEDP